ncbi:MAG: polar amino acid ABC transporter permease [Herpetosiphonaceae bacterium]|nr:MAG: polar amino acid ABC transporter permease [Herpetosiphonaceae bacterium]
MASTGLSPEYHRRIPFYRNVKTLAILAQVVFILLVGLLFWYLYSNMVEGMRRSNIPSGFDFLDDTAGFPISEGIAYEPTDTYARAFVVGLVNTLRVSALGIVLATLLGIVIGIARLSSNWLLRTVASAYVQLIRNIPLIVLLIFIFVGVILKLPRVRDAVGIEGVLLLSNRGLAMAWPRSSDSYNLWVPWLVGSLVVGVVVYEARRRYLKRVDRPGASLPWALLAMFGVIVLGAVITTLISGRFPLVLDRPRPAGFNLVGGTALTGEFFALLMGLTLYTAAFIAEIVRGGILAVSKGQREAARALGLTPAQTMRLVIFPQALRVIIPPMTNQYLNLTKNSSLGIAIGYFDLFNVSKTIFNQSGRTVPVIVLVMASYLSISLLTSLIMNIYNRRMRVVER